MNRDRRAALFGRLLVHTVYPVHVSGGERVPESGPVVVAVSDIGRVDALVAGAAGPRHTTFLLPVSAFDSRYGRLWRWAGHLALTDDAESALTAARQRLAAGGCVGADVPLAVDLARAAGAPIVPVRLAGRRPAGAPPLSRPRLGGDVFVLFGEPMAEPDEADARAVMAALVALTPQVEHTAATTQLLGVRDNG